MVTTINRDGQKSRSYDLITLVRPGISQEEINQIVALLTQIIEEDNGAVYKSEHSSTELKFKIKDYQSATIIVVCWAGYNTNCKYVADKIRYNTKILRSMILSVDHNEVSRFADLPLVQFIHPLNKRLADCLSENDRILPFRYTKKHVQNTKKQREAAFAIKAARVLGLFH